MHRCSQARILEMVAIVLCLLASSAAAQIAPGDGLLTLNGGYVSGKSVFTGKTVDGGAAAFTFERLDWSDPVSFGFSLGYAAASGDSAGTRTSINAIPVFIGGKYWLGKGKVQGYIGTALGIYFNWLQRENRITGESNSSVGAADFGLGVPVGATLSIGETAFINANYTLNWLWENDLFEDNLMHSFNLGVGFRL